MKMKFLPSSLILGAALMLGSIATAPADDSSTVKLTLQNTGFDPDASGMVLSTLKSKSSLFSISAAGLAPGNDYVLMIGNIPEATLTADSKGRARAQFMTPAKKGSLVLDFDPHGQLVSLVDGTNSVLQAVVSGVGEPAGTTVDERVNLSAASGPGQASLRYTAQKNADRTFEIQLRNISDTNWSLFVNGIFRGAIPIKKSGGGIVFDSNGNPLLDFDPRGQVIDIAQDTNIVFSGELEAQIKNVNVATPSVGAASIPSTGADPDAVASARIRVDSDATRHFSVELENLPQGAYELLADGISEGSINVAVDGSETDGEIEFSSRSDSNEELPLTFDPTNAVFTVQQSNVVYFQGALVFGIGVSNNAPVEIDQALASTGLDANAHADARFEIDDQGRDKFRVEIEDIAVGAYQLWVAGVQRGTINAKTNSSGVAGEIEFESPNHDAGQFALNFDPRGQLIEVKNATGTFFSQLFGTGDTNVTLTLPLRIELPLFNVGPATNASAGMTFKRDDRNRESFEVEIEDAAAGDYQLLVGGVLRATVTVVAGSGETMGQVGFETHPDGGNLLLDFDPLGQEVMIVKGGITYFDRTLPAN
jgi:hypothetical protein